MFNRKEYKKNALTSLKGNWLDLCLLSTILLAISVLSNCASLVVFSGIYGILSVGFISVLIKHISSDEKISFNSFLDSLGTHWLPALLGGLWRLLWVFLWSLLFLIPGIIKFYSYSMMPFVIAENPKIGVQKAMNISKILTNGYKSDLFVLHLSFLGWAFLCLLTSGVGFIALYPYYKATQLNAYYDLKKMAFLQGKLVPSDFN